MTMASGLYVPTFRGVLATTPLVCDLTLATNKVILVTDTYSPNFSTHNDYADITNELPSSGGYTQNNKQVGGTPQWNDTDVAGTLEYNWSAPVQWTSASFTARGMIVTTAVATGLLICAVTFTQDYTATNGNFTITPAATGVFNIDMIP